MATYIINEGSSQGTRKVEAKTWAEESSFVVFYDDGQERVYAMPVAQVTSIKRKSD